MPIPMKKRQIPARIVCVILSGSTLKVFMHYRLQRGGG